MAKKKLYFSRFDDEHCFPKQYHLDNMAAEGVSELTVFEAKPISDNQYFFCKAVGEIGERGECGKSCIDYAPCNGKSGKCKHVGRLYEPTNVVTIKL